MNSPVTAAIIAEIGACTPPSPMDDIWAQLFDAVSLEEHQSKASSHNIDDYWSALTPIDELWADFMVSTPTAEHLTEPLPGDADKGSPMYAKHTQVFDWGDFADLSPISNGSTVEAAAMGDEQFENFSGCTFVETDSAGDMDIPEIQSSLSTLSPTCSSESSQSERYVREASLDEETLPLRTPGCPTHTQQHQVSEKATEEHSGASGSELNTPASRPHATASLVRRRRDSKRSHRGKNNTKPKSRNRKHKASGDCEYFPPGVKAKDGEARKTRTSGMTPTSPCLRVVSVGIYDSDVCRLYSLNRLQGRWTCNAGLSSELVDPQDMRQSADTWLRGFMEVSVYVDDQRLCFRWGDMRQIWVARDFSGEDVLLEHEVLLKLIETPLNSIWLD